MMRKEKNSIFLYSLVILIYLVEINCFKSIFSDFEDLLAFQEPQTRRVGEDIAWEEIDPSNRTSIKRSIIKIKPFINEFINYQVHTLQGIQVIRDRAVCSPHEHGNSSFNWFSSAINRCASPFFQLREIFPEQLMWSEAPEGTTSKKKGPQNSSVTSGQDSTENISDKLSGSETTKTRNQLVGFFLAVNYDPQSQQYQAVLTGIAAAFPEIWFVKGDGPKFSRFTAQYGVRSFPQLLLFENGRLLAKHKGKRTHGAVAAFLTQHTGLMPNAVVLSFAPGKAKKPPFDYALLLSSIYVFINCIMYCYKKLRRA